MDQTIDGREQKIRELTAKEESINKQLQDVFAQRSEIDNKFTSLSNLFERLKTIKTEARTIAETINRTADLSDTITGKIRQLDVARARVSECQSRLNDLIDLQLCSDDVKDALKRGDYEKAAGDIHRFLSMDRTLLEQTAIDISANTGSTYQSVNVLQEAAEQLKGIIRVQFVEATEKNDIPNIERYFKIFPLLDLHADGLVLFAKYLCTKIQKTCSENLDNALRTRANDKRATIIYADTFTLLFEGIARVIEFHSPLIETYYGPGRLSTVVAVLQNECDRQAKKIYNEFVKRRQIEKILQAKNLLIISKTTGNTDLVNRVELKDLDVLITEICVMHSRAVVYCRFLQKRVATDVEVGPTSVKSGKLTDFNAMMNESGLNQCMYELINNYLILEDFFMEETVKKAISLDKVDDRSLKISSVVDDVFFIIRKCIRRAISTGSLEAVCTMCNNACTILNDHYCQVIQDHIKQGYPSGYMDLTQAYNVLQSSIQQGRIHSSNDMDQTRLNFLVYLNNANVSIEYVERLCTVVVEETIHGIKSLSDNERVKLESCVSGFSTAIANLRQWEENGMKRLQSSAIKPRITAWVDEFLNVSHEFTEEEFSDYEAHETFIQTLIMHLEGFLNSFRADLTESNFDTLVSVLTSDIVAQLEKNIFKSKFNRLGGLVVDKEVRALLSYLTSTTSWSIRDKFTRLIQIATILNVENVAEIAEFENSGNFQWHLNPSELRRTVSLRTDFTANELARLKI